ncbi:MAG: hypothetical protein JWM32_321 [Verrucomicrobia bacterium]|nr:hypothetical protein [Verrucomicrobiota bacterium]
MSGMRATVPVPVENKKPQSLLTLSPVTLGKSSKTPGAISALFDPARKCWRVKWRAGSGAWVEAQCVAGERSWTKPAVKAGEPDTAPDSPPPVGDAARRDAPEGVLAMQSLDGGRVAVRTGKRVVGRPPVFPSASLVLTVEDTSGWRDFAFADETPEVEVISAALALAPGFWLAAYLVADGAEGGVCRVVQVASDARPEVSKAWEKLPPYPQAPGMAGIITGQHRGVIIAAGGANFPDLPPWENGKKKIYDEIYVLLPGKDAWQSAGRLPGPRGYGAVVSVPDGVLIAGGEDGERVFADTLLLQWDGDKVQVRQGPALPAPTTCAVGAVLDGKVYVAGGYAAGAPRLSQSIFWSLDLGKPAGTWEQLPPVPGKTRALAVAAAVGGAFYLCSGIEISAVPGKAPAEAAPGVYLKDAYRYRPGAGWEKLPDLPWSAIAASSPAPVTESPARVFVMGGVDGRQVGNLPRATVLPNDIIYFDIAGNQWKHWHEAWPMPVVCIPAVEIDAGWLLASGEIMAGKRTTETWLWRIEA